MSAIKHIYSAYEHSVIKVVLEEDKESIGRRIDDMAKAIFLEAYGKGYSQGLTDAANKSSIPEES